MEEVLLKKQPINIEFSYETMCHTKISPDEYELSIAIPQSTKYIGYMTLLQAVMDDPSLENTNPFYPILIIYELNRFRKITNIHTIATVQHSYCEIAKWMNETMFYGSIIDGFFVIEDILYYNGISSRTVMFKEKLDRIIHIISLSEYFEYLPHPDQISLKLVLPFISKTPTDEDYEYDNPNIPTNDIPYRVHHIQYRSLTQIKPILNANLTRIGGSERNKHNVTPPKSIPFSICKFNFNKPQYKKQTVFEIVADHQYDVYHLYAFNNTTTADNNKRIFVDVAFIPDYQTSKMMNRIFRKIKENDNLDYIEESDDDEEFNNQNIDKYVILNKKEKFECQFHNKFKKWIPICHINNTKNYGRIVPISNL